MATVKQHPRDFRVDEVELYPPDGDGSHCLLRVEKEGLTTDHLVSELAARAGVEARSVGFAGRKDRWAVTRQWLSVPEADPDDALAWRGEGWRVLEAVAHRQKLRLGHLRANRFQVRVRDVPRALLAEIRDRFSDSLEAGFANRFGSQRFGRHGGNADKARRLLRGEIRIRNRRMARFLISALQSEAFNRTLERRHEVVPEGTGTPWRRLVSGDVAQVVASGGAFRVDDAALEQPRASRFEIVPTGPIPGAKMMLALGAVGDLERSVLEETGCLQLVERRLPKLRIDGARRALAVRPSDGSLVVGDVDLLRDQVPESSDTGSGETTAVDIGFTLPPGSFATVLLEDVFDELEDASRSSRAAER